MTVQHPACGSARYAVTATYSGELVYVHARDYPCGEMLNLTIAPVTHTADEAERVATLARADESLSRVSVDQVDGPDRDEAA